LLEEGIREEKTRNKVLASLNTLCHLVTLLQLRLLSSSDERGEFQDKSMDATSDKLEKVVYNAKALDI